MPSKPNKDLKIVAKSPLKSECPQMPNYHNYFITDSGLVYSFERKRWLKPAYSMNVNGIKTGYICQTLKVNGEIKRLYVHRIVAEVYLLNLDHKATVNHKDGNKSNNNVSNLEWSTLSENIQHSYDVLKRNPVNQIIKAKVRKQAIIKENKALHWLDKTF